MRTYTTRSTTATRTVSTIVGGLLAAAALAGCSGSSDSSGTGDAGGGASAGADLATADSSLGTIVVDGVGLTAYIFDQDQPGSGTSACTGGCASAWPAITTTSEAPDVDGVTGTVGTIPASDGSHHITLNGLPLYTYAQDSGPGDVTGHGVGDVWWAVAPDGTPAPR